MSRQTRNLTHLLSGLAALALIPQLLNVAVEMWPSGRLRRFATRPLSTASWASILPRAGKQHSLAQGQPEPSDRYLFIVSAEEGMSGWAEVLKEALVLSTQLNRTLVEPCVLNSALVSCELDRVATVSDGSDPADWKAMAAGADPDGATLHRLEPGTVGCVQKTRLLPLRAYFDWVWLSKHFSIMSFNDWAQRRVARAQQQGISTPWVDADNMIHVRVPAFYPAERVDLDAPWISGGFAFSGTLGWRGNQPPTYKEIAAATTHLANEPELFIVSWHRPAPIKWFESSVRERWRPVDALPPFNPLHYVAARTWVAEHVVRGGRIRDDGDSDTRYGVLQWRSLAATATDQLQWCVNATLIELSRLPLLGVHFPSDQAVATTSRSSISPLKQLQQEQEQERQRMVLVSDLPADSNVCGIWDNNWELEADLLPRQEAAAAFQRAGFAKYDADHGHLDGGVLAIRDWILAAEATWYFTCSELQIDVLRDEVTPICTRCHYQSGYVNDAVNLRIAAGRPVTFRIDGLDAEDVTQLLPPPASASHPDVAAPRLWMQQQP